MECFGLCFGHIIPLEKTKYIKIPERHVSVHKQHVPVYLPNPTARNWALRGRYTVPTGSWLAQLVAIYCCHDILGMVCLALRYLLGLI